MSDAKHTPDGDPSFRASLIRNLAAAAGLVVVVALAFWAIGSFGGPTSPVAVDDGSEDDGAGAEVDGEVDGDGAGTGEGGSADDEPADADDPDADDPDADDPSPDEAEEPEAEDDADDPGAEDDTGEDTEDGEDGDADAVDPSGVSIQVLDGVKADGGTAADGVAAQLGDAGYRVVARNDALTYEVTTVLYNPGNEGAARQVADALGGAEVREQPGNLSTSVDLHVVVGRDRA